MVNCQQKVTSVMNMWKIKECVALEAHNQYLGYAERWDRMFIVFHLVRECGIGPKAKSGCMLKEIHY